MTVVFSGENPGLTLFRKDSEIAVARASYWRCVYSEEGEGNALLIWVDPEHSGLGDLAPHAIFADNTGVARLVTDRFTRHFDGFNQLGFENIEPEYARFFQDSDSRWYHRVTVNDGSKVIELVWWDVMEQQLRQRSGMELGPSTWELATVICPCESAEIRVSNQPVDGEVHSGTNDDGAFSSSFLAFSETWAESS